MSRLRWLLVWRRQHDDLAREMRAHIAERVDDLIEGGAPEAAARLQARREFGSVAQLGEQSREVWVLRWIDTLRASVRDAGRTFRRSASALTGCLLVLGAATGLFVSAAMVADDLLLHPVRLPDIDRVISIAGLADPDEGWTFSGWWGQARSFDHLTRWRAGLTELTTDEGSFLVNTAFVEPAFPELFRTPPLLGRPLAPIDFRTDTPVRVVINESLWAARFNRAPDVIGVTSRLSDVQVVIVGVLPTVTAFRHDVQVWVPRAADSGFGMIRSTGGGTHARLVDGAGLEDARQDIQTLGTRLNAGQGSKTGISYFGTFSLDTVTARMARPLRIPVLALLASSVALLAMALANSAILLLNVVIDRRQELAVRASLGASRRRLVAQAGFESALVGCAAGTIGGAAGVLLLRSARPLLAPLSPYLVSADAAWTTVQAGLVVGGVLGLLAGLVPLSLSFARRDWSLLSHRQTDRGSLRGRRLRTTLVDVQVTAAMMLVTGAGAAIQTFLASNATSLGFDPSRVLALRVVVPPEQTPTATVDAIRANVRSAGLVDAAAMANRLPVVDSGGMWFVGPDGTTPARVQSVEPGYFRAMGMSFIEGRDFTWDSGSAVIVSDFLAHRLWPDRSAVGQALQANGGSRQVIGVVGDVQEDIDADAFYPGLGGGSLYTLLPTSSAPGSAEPEVRALVMRCSEHCEDAIDGVREIAEATGATVLDLTSLHAAFTGKVESSRIRSTIAVAAGVLGLLMALTGIYGVVRHVASTRLQEVTIRMALGATPAQARTVILRYGSMIVLAGVLAGTGLAWLLLSSVRPLLYGVSATDPASYVVAGLALATGGLLAMLGPAIRIGRLDSRRLLSE